MAHRALKKRRTADHFVLAAQDIVIDLPIARKSTKDLFRPGDGCLSFRALLPGDFRVFLELIGAIEIGLV